MSEATATDNAYNAALAAQQVVIAKTAELKDAKKTRGIAWREFNKAKKAQAAAEAKAAKEAATK